jgi:hypothetical protein
VHNPDSLVIGCHRSDATYRPMNIITNIISKMGLLKCKGAKVDGHNYRITKTINSQLHKYCRRVQLEIDISMH